MPYGISVLIQLLTFGTFFSKWLDYWSRTKTNVIFYLLYSMIYKPFALVLLFKISIAKIWNLVQSKKNPLISHKTKDCLVFLSLAAFDVYFIVKLGKHEKKFLFSSLEKLIFALNTLFLTISEMIKDRKNRNKKNNFLRQIQFF